MGSEAVVQLITDLGSFGFILWMFYRVFTKTIPNLISSFEKNLDNIQRSFERSVMEIKESFENQSRRQRESFDRALQLQRDNHKELVKTIEESRISH